MNQKPIACNLNALNKTERERRAELAMALRSALREIIPTADGYTFHLDEKENLLTEIAEFVGLERRCCPFLSFQINIDSSNHSISIGLSGREGVKEFLAAEFDLSQTG